MSWVLKHFFASVFVSCYSRFAFSEVPTRTELHSSHSKMSQYQKVIVGSRELEIQAFVKPLGDNVTRTYGEVSFSPGFFSKWSNSCPNLVIVASGELEISEFSLVINFDNHPNKYIPFGYPVFSIDPFICRFKKDLLIYRYFVGLKKIWRFSSFFMDLKKI